MLINTQRRLFSFFITNQTITDEIRNSFNYINRIGDYIFCCDSNTPIQHAKHNGRELVIFGYAVDVINGQSENLAETVLKSTANLQDVINYEKNFGGKYVVFYSEGDNCYCIGDATCSVPVFYTTGLSGFICSSNQQTIIENTKIKPDPILKKIRDSGPLNQAMPYDTTQYKEIKQLIPNHYLDFHKETAMRFINSQITQKEISPEEAAEITAPMIEKITSFYLSKFKIYCPLTSGRDSRVVYAFLKSATNEVNSYTIWHDRFKNDNQDWEVPLRLTELCGTKHERIYKETVTEELKKDMDEVLGENAYPQDAFTLAVTVNKNYAGFATVEGDIIGQVGKCSLHRNIPHFLATPSYFRCKLHNYSEEAKLELKKWMNEIKDSGEKVNTFDLFSVENRLGVWASHTHRIRNVLGQPYLNIFNSRSIIYVWTAVDRARRMNSEIHVSLIQLKAPELLAVPFEADKKGFVVLAKSSAPAFYLGSFAKYYIQKRAFQKKKKYN